MGDCLTHAAPGLPGRIPGGIYARRRPEETVLYQLVDRYLEQFLSERAERSCGNDLPPFVKRELRAFLACGILERGFLRVHCGGCGRDALVAFSCKGRGICPSCGGRRMVDTAAHLVDRVFPLTVPVRQWVLTLPFQMRFLAAFNREVCSAIRAVFVRAVLGWYRRRAKLVGIGIADGKSGAVCVTQRFGSALNTNVHFHSLFLDGVYYRPSATLEPESPSTSKAQEQLAFQALDRPTSTQVGELVATVARRITRMFERRGYGGGADTGAADCSIASEDPVLAACLTESLFGLDVERVGKTGDAEPYEVSGECCAVADGFSLHAATSVEGGDCSALEKICRYVMRPAIATERLHLRNDGKVTYEFKHPFRDGTRAVVFDPMVFLARLAALVPPARAHLVTYSGVLAPNSAMRKEIVPRAVPPASAARSAGEKKNNNNKRGTKRTEALPDTDAAPVADAPWSPPVLGADRPRYYCWADLLKRAFAIDILQCPECGGTREVIALIMQPSVIRAILECLDLSTVPPVDEPHGLAERADYPDRERAPPEPVFEFDAPGPIDEPPPDGYDGPEPEEYVWDNERPV